MDGMTQIFAAQKKHSLTLRSEPVSARISRLRALQKALTKHEESLLKALNEDLGKHPAESLVTEIQACHHEIKFFIKNLRCWSRPRRVRAPFLLLGTKNYLRCEPKGTVLIISPWNYPLNLAIEPLIAAIGAGNTVILKPSELAPKTAKAMELMLTETFQPEEVAVFLGDAQVSQDLLKLPFDHIFFTGSTRVGRAVMQAAAATLTPVTLELGGKSPTLVDESCDLELTAKKIAWGKFINSGQTCVAPDYVMVQKSIYPRFLELLKKAIYEMFGETRDLPANTSYGKIISAEHFQRLKQMLTQSLGVRGSLEEGGQFFDDEQKIAPTLISDVDPSSPLMQEEIFGPLLPLLTFQELNEAIAFINSRPKPLALYIFSKNKQNIENVLSHTSSGGVAINDVVLHLINPYLPFGGVGESGMGHYHGQFGFRTFSHEKGVLRQGFLGRMITQLYPPYTSETISNVKRLGRI